MIAEKSKKEIVIADRFFTTTLCYQTLEGVNEEVALRFADDFGIIKPDIAFFLDVSVKTAIQWKSGEDKIKNFREEDHAFIQKTYDKYQDLVKRNVWTNWIKIDGERSKTDVNQSIIEVIQKKYGK
jgi:thymidylate kinase